MADVAVKICGVTRPEDAAVAVRAGARFVGSVLSSGFGRSVDPDVAATFPIEVGSGVQRVGVFVDEPVEYIVDAARRATVDIVQLHGDESPEFIQVLQALGPWKVWKAIRVDTHEEVRAVVDRFGSVVDGLLFDGSVGSGGHGLRFPWEAVEAEAGNFPEGVTVITGGGLKPDNVGDAVTTMRPDVVDVSSGVEAELRVKDEDRVRAFIRAALAASRALNR